MPVRCDLKQIRKNKNNPVACLAPPLAATALSTQFRAATRGHNCLMCCNAAISPPQCNMFCAGSERRYSCSGQALSLRLRRASPSGLRCALSETGVSGPRTSPACRLHCAKDLSVLRQSKATGGPFVSCCGKRAARQTSKYPPAEPGALLIGPLEAAMGSLTRPRFVWPPERGRVNATDSSDPDAYPLSLGS